MSNSYISTPFTYVNGRNKRPLRADLGDEHLGRSPWVGSKIPKRLPHPKTFSTFVHKLKVAVPPVGTLITGLHMLHTYSECVAPI